MPQSLASVTVHLVFSTKHREPRIAEEWSPRLYDFLGGIARTRKSTLLCAGGMPDHVHLLISMGREVSIADLVRDLKAGSSRWVHDTFPSEAAFAWQAGYGIFSVSHSLTGKVRDYIQNQREHHREMSFQDEFRSLLRKHDEPFDERYVWD